MNKIGIYYLYWTKSWFADIAYYVSKVAKLGFDILEVSSRRLLDMSRFEQEKIRSLAEKENIELTFCLSLFEEYDISSEDINVRKKGIEYVKRNIEIVHNMGGKSFSGVNYGAWFPSINDEHLDKTSYLERSVNSMKEIIKIAEDLGVFYNVEVVNRYEQFMLNTCEEAIDYINRVGSPNLKIHLDTFHMNIEEESIEKAIVKAGAKLGHLHISENNRDLPGKGHISWDEVIRALKKIIYNGNIVMEPFIQPGGEVGRAIKVWRDMSIGSNLDEEARRALTFIREKLRAN